MTRLLVLGALVCLAAVPAVAQDPRDGTTIPKGYAPPPGDCRVWYDGLPAKEQPAPTDCATAQRIAARLKTARVVYGDRSVGGSAQARGNLSSDRNKPTLDPTGRIGDRIAAGHDVIAGRDGRIVGRDDRITGRDTPVGGSNRIAGRETPIGRDDRVQGRETALAGDTRTTDVSARQRHDPTHSTVGKERLGERRDVEARPPTAPFRSADQRYPSPNNDSRTHAFRNGYQDGAEKMREDLRTGARFNPTRHRWYASATRGYNSSLGSREQYADAYRAGFVEGYRKAAGK